MQASAQEDVSGEARSERRRGVCQEESQQQRKQEENQQLELRNPWNAVRAISGGFQEQLLQEHGKEEEKHPLQSRKSWRAVRATNGLAPKLKNHTTTLVDGSRIIVFGGYDGESNHDHVHEFDCVSLQWRELEVRGERPKGRNGHTVCFVLVFLLRFVFLFSDLLLC